MASLLKFKLLATQCGVTQSPTRSPRTSPVVHIRRRKTTLRMLLTRNTGHRSPRRSETTGKNEKKNEKDLMQRNTLKDLFVSSPPVDENFDEIEEKTVTIKKSQGFASIGNGEDGHGLNSGRSEPGSHRPIWTGLRYRFLLRRAWRPVLVAIPE